MSKAMYALGRLKVGAMNKTEAAYDKHLALMQHAGEIQWRKFEGLKLRLADNTFYTPDFAVMLANGQIEMHEVKGARGIFTDDAKVKVKVAAEMYPFLFVVAFPIPKNKGGGWEFERYE
jgi:hypothetical protein